MNWAGFQAICVAFALFVPCTLVAEEAPNAPLETSLTIINADEGADNVDRDDDDDSSDSNDSSALLDEWFHLSQTGISIFSTLYYDESTALLGGLLPGHWAGQNLLMVNARADLDKLFHWRNATLGLGFVSHRGSDTTQLTGDVQDFNELDAIRPKSRGQLSELWLQQYLFGDRFRIRAGKMDCNDDFAASLGAAIFLHNAHGYPTTIYLAMPSYPDTGTGVTAFAYPNELLYAGFGFFDGRLSSTGIAIGERGPQFDGRYFYIGEAGLKYKLGRSELEGRLGFGAWGQTGPIPRFTGGFQQGTTGLYALADQWLWRPDDAKVDDDQGISVFLQAGNGDGVVNLFTASLAGGIVWTGFMDNREDDSLGFGFAWSDLTDEPGAQQFSFPQFPSGELAPSELAFQICYLVKINKHISVQPNLTYIHSPGIDAGIPDALALTLRAILDF